MSDSPQNTNLYSDSLERLYESIRKNSHGISEQEVHALAEVLLKNIAEKMADGYKLAFLHKETDGAYSLTVVDIDVENDTKPNESS